MRQLGILNAIMFGVGAVGSLWSGRLIGRLGDPRLASACLIAVAHAMLCMMAGLASLAELIGVLWLLTSVGGESQSSP